MKSKFTSVALSAGLALALAGCAAGGDPSAQEANGAPPTANQEHQQRVASTTLALEKAYDDQFAKGKIDSDALQPLIYDVLQSFPEDKRPQVQQHIYDVISKGQKDASEMTAEQRAELASPVSADKLGAQRVEVISAWGWGYPTGYAAAGGCGGTVAVASTGCGGGVYGTAYGYPGYGYGAYGYGYPGYGYAAYGYPGYGYGAYGYPAYGYGYGGWGWGWGGYGAFAWPSCGWGYGYGW